MNRLYIFLFIVCISFSSTAFSQNVNSGNYDIYYADIDGDGLTDVYFHGKEQFLLIHGDIIVPIIVAAPISFVLYQRSYGYDAPVAYTSLDVSGYQRANINDDFYLGDFDGDGLDDILMRGKDQNDYAVVLRSTAGGDVLPVILAEYDSADLQHNLSDRSVVISLVDTNFDGRVDITIDSGDPAITDYVYISSASGIPAESPPEPIIGGDTSVGASGGSYSVEDDGAMSYVIPLVSPEGIGGMSPQVSLNYSSNSGDGEAGIGWSLGGLSQIERCPTGQDFGETIDAVDFDAQDKFCLDGMPLVAINGVYGASGTEYRTRKESFTKIVSHGSQGSCARDGANVKGPTWFEVTTATGRVLEYGRTADSRLLATGCQDVINWGINKESDTFNNAVSYSYTQLSGEQLINRIDYNGNSTSLRFTFENRPDTSVSYYAGSEFQSTKRLQKVEVYESSQQLHEYRLAYSNAGINNASRLIQFAECAGGQCLLATTFGWSESELGFNPLQKQLTPSDAGGKPTYSSSGSHEWWADVDGDAITDRVWVPNGYTEVWVSKGSPAGLQTASRWLAQGAGGVTSTSSGGQHTKLGDVNGDGKADLVWIPEGSTGLYVALSNGNGFNTPTEWRGLFTPSIPLSSSGGLYERLIDINVDGLNDWVWRPDGRNEIWVMLSNGNSFDAEKKWLGIDNGIDRFSYNGQFDKYVDLNGDGILDKAWMPYGVGSGSVWVALGDGVGFKTPTIWLQGQSSADTNITPRAGSNETYVDVNGDGLPDRVWTSLNSLKVALSTGAGFKPYEVWLTVTNNVMGEIYPYSTVNETYIDLNNDGRADKLWIPAGRNDLWASFSTGSGFTAPQFWMSTATTGNYYPYSSVGSYETYQDVTGDGYPDKIWMPSGHTDYWVATSKNKPIELISVTNSFGSETKFTYKNLTDSSVFEKGTTANFPVVSVVSPSRVTSKIEFNNGLGGFNSQSFFYKDLRVHLAGKGMLGFKEMVVTDDVSGAVTRTIYSQDHATRSQNTVKEIIATAANGTELSHMWNKNFALVDYGSGDTYRYQQRVPLTETITRDLDGTFLHKEVTTLSNFDGFNNPSTSVVQLFDQASVLLRTTTVNRVLDTYKPGQVLRMTVTTEVSGKAPRTKVSTWNYDAVTGRLTDEQIRHPDTDMILVDTRYGVDANGYPAVDSFGNNLAITISGPDFQSRTSYVTFDPSGRRITSKTNALGHTVSTEYYPATGMTSGAFPHKPKEITDTNGVKTRFYYDVFGRVTKTSAAWGTVSQVDSVTALRFCDSSCPANSVYYVVSYTEGGAEARTYIDALGRTLRKGIQSVRVIGDAPEFVYVDYQFDIRGRNTAVSEPYFESTSPVLWSNVEYDDLNRTTRSITPDGRVDATTYAGFSTVSQIDIYDKNQRKSALKDAFGNLIRATDDDFNDLDYNYDSHGNLLSVTDPANNVIQMTYDVLGRKTSMNDPTKGAWSYTYNSLGQLITETNARGETSCNAYDVLSRKVKRIDLYQGATSSSVGASSQATNQCVGDTANTKVATWIYDTAPGAGVGKLHKALGEDGFEQVNSYTSLGLPYESIATINGVSYATTTLYDQLNRPVVNLYPGTGNRLETKTVYNELGIAVEVRNATTNALYYQLEELNVRGQVVYESFGNGVTTARGYDDQTAKPTQIGSYRIGSGSFDVQDLTVTFDSIGNLSERTDHLNNYHETSGYDDLNRLTSINADMGNGDIRTTDITYNNLGNILTKTGVGTYKYGSQCATGYGPHAVCEITGSKNASYTYDLNGNMVSGDGRTIAYTTFDKPSLIQKGSAATEYSYGPSRNRYFRRDTVNGKVTDYTYVGAYEKVEFKDNGTTVNKTEERHYIGGFAIVTIENRNSPTEAEYTKFLHKDHLGSISTITDEVGNIVETMSFDPWGKRRAPSLAQLESVLNKPWSNLSSNEKGNYTINPLTLSSAVTNRGFTGHEQIDGVGLIHMGGRIYDPEIGRMIQADPFIPVATDLQAYNRYAYVRNNPLSLVDPSGYSWLSKARKRIHKKIDPIRKKARAINRKVLHRALPGYNVAHETYKWSQPKIHKAVMRGRTHLPLSVWVDERLMASENTRKGMAVVMGIVDIWCGGFCSAAYSAHITTLMGGDWNDAARAFATSFASSYANSAIKADYGKTWTWGRVFKSATVSGAAAEASGGDFLDGFSVAFAMGAVRKGWSYTEKVTNELKELSCAQNLSTCKPNKWGELLTDGGRGPLPGSDTSGDGNFITRGGMALEASGEHLYNENSIIGRYVNFVSKTHDWSNSNLSQFIGFDGYDNATGMWVAGSESYNTMFQVYSFVGMIPAAVFTSVAIAEPLAPTIVQNRYR